MWGLTCAWRAEQGVPSRSPGGVGRTVAGVVRVDVRSIELRIQTGLFAYIVRNIGTASQLFPVSTLSPSTSRSCDQNVR